MNTPAAPAFHVLPVPPVQTQSVEAPLSPRVRAFILIAARALQMIVNGLQELASEPKRG